MSTPSHIGSLQSAPVRRVHRRAFTLVELLVVVLILAILMAIVLPLYLSAINSSARRTARSNLQTLVNAEQAYRLASATHSYTADLKVLSGPSGQIDSVPAGPGQTKYTLYIGGQTTEDGRVVPDDGVAACAKDTTRGSDGTYGCFIPGVDTE
jgi:prepilin-type N-terminal cleavage/methylation domain-containing protein